jgi:hypothetical protein
MQTRILILTTVVFFLIAALAFCVIGFLASYEPPGFPEFRLLYSFVGVACLFGIAWVLFPGGLRALPCGSNKGDRRSSVAMVVMKRWFRSFRWHARRSVP